jgi:hypothetical protein
VLQNQARLILLPSRSHGRRSRQIVKNRVRNRDTWRFSA